MYLSADFFAEAIGCPLARAQALAPALRQTMERYSILVPSSSRQTYFRVSHWLAQIAHESLALKVLEENLNYSASGLLRVFPKYFTAQQAEQYARQPERIASRVYASRMGNGLEASGDGWRYRGRGAIQLTGRDNYRAYTRHLQGRIGSAAPNFDAAPDLVKELPWSIDVAGFYWNSQSISTWADADDLRMVTIRVNGGVNGLPDRAKRLVRAKQVLLAEMHLQKMTPRPPEVL